VRAQRHLLPILAGEGRLVLDEGEMSHWGSELGRAIVPPLLITLTGDLGTGKTTLAKAICYGYGVEDTVSSPTFSLVQRYSAPKSPVYHVDLFRLKGETDLTNIGWDDLLGEHAVVLVEWPERAGTRIPDDHLPLDIDYAPGDPHRRVLLAG
jgi:tRNA threonylcarbamoyladenosine biosynthesis protein TsaE